MPTTFIHDIYRGSAIFHSRFKHIAPNLYSIGSSRLFVRDRSWYHTSCHISHHVRSIMNIMWLISYHIPGSYWYHFQCISYVIDHANLFHSWYIPTSAFFHSRAFCFRVKNTMWLISYHIPGSSWYTYHIMWDQWKTLCGRFRITYLADHSF